MSFFFFKRLMDILETASLSLTEFPGSHVATSFHGNPAAGGVAVILLKPLADQLVDFAEHVLSHGWSIVWLPPFLTAFSTIEVRLSTHWPR